MAFLAPAVLAGAALVAAPIAIHLLNKTRVKVVRWAATRFLLESLQKNQRRLQIEDLLLLLLRCMFLVLLALAFARLVLNPGASQDVAGSGPVVTVLLVDQSASMGQSDGFRTRFDQAKESADKMIGAMGAGSQAALFLVGSRVNQVVPRPIPNLPFVRRSVDVAALTDQTSDMGSAIQLALEALKPFAKARKEIVVFTDGQASAWPDIEKIQKILAEAPDVRLSVVDSGAKTGEDNLAITALQSESGSPAAGQLTPFVVEVSNFGAAQANGVRVTLSVDDGAPVDEAVLDTIEPGKSRAIRLNARFAKPGYYTLKAATPADRMPADNERSVAVHIIDHMNATIVEGAAGSKTNASRDGFFLANALTPVAPSRKVDYYLKVNLVAPSWLATADLSGQKIIFLSNVGKIDATGATNLEKYVREGGALVVFPGSRVQPAVYNDDPVLSAMMPAQLGPMSDAATVAWQSNDYTHPVTSLWSDAKVGNLGSVRATKYFPLALAAGRDARAVVKYSDGSPAVAEASFGQGRVVLFSSAATTDWNNLPIHPNFVPFLRRLVDYLSPDMENQALALTPGTVFQAKVSSDLASREVTAVTPTSGGKARAAGKVELVNKDAVIRYRDTAKAGAYRFYAAGVEPTVAAFAVQMDPAESNLKMLEVDKFARLQSGQEAADGTAVEAAAPLRVRRELWIVFLLAAFAVALAEMVLAHKFSFAK